MSVRHSVWRVLTGTVGTGLLASGVGFVAGLVLEVTVGIAGLFDVVGIAARRRWKAAKHDTIRILASCKLNTVHSHIIKALEDCAISDEYKFNPGG